MTPIDFTSHDDCPPEATAVVDQGLDDSNSDAAPLHEVQSIACFARTSDGKIVGGAVGRWWGACCELQQLWVEPGQRRQGIGAQLVKNFESRGREHACTHFYLETFSFQAPALYRALGYAVEYERTCYPHGITKLHMAKVVAARAAID